MPYVAPTLHDAGHDVPLKLELRLSMPFEPAIHAMADAIFHDEGKKPRKDAYRNICDALCVILANLLRAQNRDPNLFVAVPRRNHSYPAGPHNPHRLGARAVQRAVNHLLEVHPPYVESMGGNHNDNEGSGYSTRLRATKRLIEELERCIADVSDIPSLADPQSVPNELLFSVADLPILRLKPAIKKEAPMRYIPLPNLHRVRQMERNLSAFNGFLGDHWIDLHLPDHEFGMLQQTAKGKTDSYFGDAGRPIELDFLYHRRLHRVFNNGTLDDGGRFYGGWWQNIPSHNRKRITINWHPTVEVDYSSMHPNMLYAMEGTSAPTDCYALDGFPVEHRNLLKTTFQKLLNATGKIRAPRIDALPEGWTWAQILDGLREFHRPISRHFRIPPA